MKPTPASSRASRGPRLAIAGLFGVVLAVAFATRLDYAPRFDAGEYHIPGARTFYDALLSHDLIHYHSATPPLPHILLGLWGRLVGFTLPRLRLLCLAAGVGSLGFFYLIAARTGPYPIWKLFACVSVPYVFWLNFTVTTEPFAAFFGLAYVALLLVPGGRWPTIALAISAQSAALWCRIPWFFLPAATLLHAAQKRFLLRRCSLEDRAEHGTLCDHWLRVLPMSVVPAATIAPLFLYWGGITPPIEFSSEKAAAFNPMQVVFFLSLLGCYSYGFAAEWILRKPRKHLGLLLVAGLALAGALRAHPIGTDTKTGLVLRGLGILDSSSYGGVSQVALAVMATVGAASVMRIVADRPQSDLVAWLAICSLLVTCSAPQFWERYHLPTLQMALLAFRVRPRDRVWLGGQCCLNAFVTVAFVLYQVR